MRQGPLGSHRRRAIQHAIPWAPVRTDTQMSALSVLMVSTLTERDAEVTLRAVDLSAVGFVAMTMAMRDAGRHNIRLDEASWAVFGKPREAIVQGAAHARLSRPAGTAPVRLTRSQSRARSARPVQGSTACAAPWAIASRGMLNTAQLASSRRMLWRPASRIAIVVAT